MVSIIKNQLLKHLSRFTKNLSADKINLSTFKGEGELSNLELDENVLTELLELPSWLRLTHAWCNRVTFRIQWTKLKNVPIQLNLDEVLIEIETCTELRSMSQQAGLSSYMSNPGKYGVIQKIIDGITVSVNTVSVTFKSPAFVATVQMSRITVESVSPLFERCELRLTRLKDPSKGQLLIFKELVWQTVRIEAQSTKDPNLTPLRLLTNQARCRIVIKKRISDCFVMGSRLVLILDDLLWVLTDSQLKAALLFLDSLAGLVQKATEVTRKAKAARKLEVLPEYQAQISQQARASEPSSAISKIFSRHDVIETSYHFLSRRIDLHLCDDPGDGRSCHPNLKDGGALQISLVHFQVDFYPYHLAASDRKYWIQYRETNSPHTQWSQQALSAFKNKFMDLIDSGRTQHTPLSRQQPHTQTNIASNGDVNNTYVQDTQQKSPSSHSSGNPVRNHVLSELAKLMTSCVVIRIQDFTLYKITTTKKQTPKELIAGDRDRYSLPDDMPIVHAEFTYYYYPGETPFPLPPSKFYVHMNPIQVNFDVDSCLWANSFVLNLHKSILSSKSEVTNASLPYLDVKIEAIMPRIIFECNTEHANQRDRPKSLQFLVSRALITNVRSGDHASRADLAKCIDTYHLGSLFFGTEFPSVEGDRYVVTDKFLRHIEATDNVRNVPTNLNCNSSYEFVKNLTKEMFWTDAKDVWSINLEPIFGDFLGTRAVGSNKPIPFLDAVPVMVWAHIRPDIGRSRSDKDTSADIHCLAHISNLVSLQINHYQVLFLLRLAEELSELTTFLGLDTNRIQQASKSSSIVLGVVLPQVEVSVIMPSHSPGKESSGGDLESVVPDSSSIGDELLTGCTQWQSSNPLDNATSTKRASLCSGAGGGAVGTPISEISSSFSMDFPANDNITTQAGNNNIKSSNGTILSKSVPSTQPFSNINISKDLNAGLSSMKKGFSSLMTSIDSAFKPGADDASDTMSVRSDISSDSENYVVVNHMAEECSDAIFRVHDDNPQIKATAVEVACEVEEDNSVTTPSEHSLASSYKRKDIVSMATFKLGKVELIHQSEGFNSSVKLQVSNVKCEECNSIPWDEFQSKFGSRSRAWIETAIDSSCSPCIKLRFDHELKPDQMEHLDIKEKMSFTKLFKDFIQVYVSNIDLDLSMSTINGLVDLLEDEVIREPVPVKIDLQCLSINLNEDRPPNNITSPGPVPINVKIQELHLSRDSDGVIVIEPSKPLTNPEITTPNRMDNNDIENLYRAFEEMKQTASQLKNDNNELRRQLKAFERVSEENRKLRRSQEETDALRSCLSATQDDLAKLLDEKKSLLDRIRDLTHELSYVELHSEKLNNKR